MKSDSTSKTPRASASTEDSDIKEKVTRSKSSKLDENSSNLSIINFYHSFQPL
jgi:hypothetical protein